MVKIHGASDDLIEVGGDWEDEIGYEGDELDGGIVALSDGTLLKVVYDGCWRFSLLVAGSVPFTRIEADAEDRPGSRPDGTPWYSDVLTFDGDIKWVAHSGQGRCVTKNPLRSTR